MVEIQEDAMSEESEFEEQEADLSPDGLSYVADAVRNVLVSKHAKYKGSCWNLSHGKTVGEILQTPPACYYGEKQISNDYHATDHSDHFPTQMLEVISQAESWVDFTSLGPPDGKFLTFIAAALKTHSDSGNEITVRILTGNIIGMPTDNDAVLESLTKHPDYELPEDTNLKIWVGSWRKGLSWNHAKIIAVDGRLLLTGGHNVWDAHYLATDPVRDLSCQAEGQVAQDGHLFANRMWKFIIKKDSEYFTSIRAPDWVPMLYVSRVGITHFPPSIDEYPPFYEASSEPLPIPEAVENGDIPIISCGRFGNLHHDESSANPSDSAIVAMLQSAQKSIKMSLQDLGPIAAPLPTGLLALGQWPDDYLREIGLAIYERGVDVHIVLSNPNSIPSPDTLGPMDANYGNGWTCEDVASEIVKAIQKAVPDADEERLAGLVNINLKLAYVRSSLGECDWAVRGKCGNHAKFFVIDDICYYIGSQNLYIANLAEWGLIVDNEEQTQKVLEEYWNPLWGASFENVPEDERDCNVDNVMSSLGIDRNQRDSEDFTEEELEAVLLAKRGAKAHGGSKNLTVWLKRASNLNDSDGVLSGGNDAYIKLRLVDADGNTVSHVRKSKVVEEGGSDPVWNQQFDFEGLQQPCSYTLKLSVWDRDAILGFGGVLDAIAADDKLGAASVDLGTLENKKEFQDFDLVVADGWFSDSTLSIALNTQGGWGN